MRLLTTIILLFINFACISQSLHLTGRIRCSNDINNLSSSGADNVIVVPIALPKQSITTTSEKSGFFNIDTKVPKEDLYDKTVTLVILTKCKTCNTYSITTFISPDRVKFNNGIYTVTLADKRLNTLCDSLRLSPIAADTLIRKISEQKNTDFKKDGWVATPSLVNLLLIMGAASAGIDSIVMDTVRDFEVSSSRMNYGKFLLHSSFTNSSNAGFNFAPNRDYSEALFWNPSCIMSYQKKALISINTNWRNLLKFSTFYKFKHFSVGFGFLESYQKERRIIYSSVLGVDDDPKVKYKLNEKATFLSASFRLCPQLNFGITYKLVSQKFDRPPNELLVERWYSDGQMTASHLANIDNLIKYKRVCSDFDLSASLKLGSSLNLGVNFMNILNSKLNGSNLDFRDDTLKIKQFASGVGLTYKYRRFNIGTDILLFDNVIYNISLGINYVPFNNALIQATYSSRGDVYSFSFRYKRFRISYIHNNKVMRYDSDDFSFMIVRKPYLYAGCIIGF